MTSQRMAERNRGDVRQTRSAAADSSLPRAPREDADEEEGVETFSRGVRDHPAGLYGVARLAVCDHRTAMSTIAAHFFLFLISRCHAALRTSSILQLSSLSEFSSNCGTD